MASELQSKLPTYNRHLSLTKQGEALMQLLCYNCGLGSFFILQFVYYSDKVVDICDLCGYERKNVASDCVSLYRNYFSLEKYI